MVQEHMQSAGKIFMACLALANSILALQPSKNIHTNKQASATSGNIKVLKKYIRIFCTTDM